MSKTIEAYLAEKEESDLADYVIAVQTGSVVRVPVDAFGSGGGGIGSGIDGGSASSTGSGSIDGGTVAGGGTATDYDGGDAATGG